jgi:hypothetical protein
MEPRRKSAAECGAVPAGGGEKRQRLFFYELKILTFGEKMPLRPSCHLERGLIK